MTPAGLFAFCQGGEIVNLVKERARTLLHSVIGKGAVKRVSDIDGQGEALFLAVSLELEHLLLDNGLCLSTDPHAEVVFPEPLFSQLANVLLYAWINALPPNTKPEQKIAQIRMEIAAGQSAQKVHRMLRRLRQRGLYVAAYSHRQKGEKI
ncbi:hypothetical protein FS594_28980 (plasmid) [Rahnella aquatilis]|nr:hypothetical protein FS594_28980 [Rahnella aquatilis]